MAPLIMTPEVMRQGRIVTRKMWGKTENYVMKDNQGGKCAKKDKKGQELVFW